MTPPSDSDHSCGWHDYALHLEQKLAANIEEKFAAAKATLAAEYAANQAALERQVQEANEQVEVLKRQLYGRRSEKTGKMPAVPKPKKTDAEVQARRAELAALRVQRVETVEQTVRVAEQDKVCNACNAPRFKPVGEGKTCTIFEYVPGYFRRTLTRRETVACTCGATILTAKAPERWSDHVQYASSFVAHLIVSKCLTVTPHYRHEQVFARLGMPIARTTLNDLFRRAGQKLALLNDPLFAEIRGDHTVYCDETSFNMTAKKSKSFLWAFVGTKLSGFHFSLTRSGDVPIAILKDSCGNIVCDDYRGYDPLERRCTRKRCGCHAHARRKFFEAGDLPEAREALDLFASIYAVEHEAARLEITGTQHHLELRRQYARPVFLRLLSLCRSLRKHHGPKTLLGRAANYTWRNMVSLGRFLRDARVRVDNNWAENALRIVALGRKNFLFVHSEEAGKELATLYSLVVSCGRNGVNPIDYLTDVLNRIDSAKPNELADLLPHRWKPPPPNSPPR